MKPVTDRDLIASSAPHPVRKRGTSPGNPTLPAGSPTIESVPQTLPNPPAQLSAEFSADPSVLTRAGIRRLLDAPRLLRLWHLASFDAPTVAVVWSLAFAWAAGVQLPLWIPVVLALAVWAIYVGDRLLDARAGLRAPARRMLRERHYFHWRHRRILLPLAAVAACAAALMVFLFMPPAAREPNSFLAAAALAYFSGVHSRRRLPRLLTKELLVGVIFTAGCALPTWFRLRGGHGSILWPFWMLVVYFATLAWLNCHAIARWEAGKRAPRAAGVLLLGCLLGLAGMAIALAALTAHARSSALLACAAASALLLALLDHMRGRLTPAALRATADFVLLTPALVLSLAYLLR